jgi:prolyl-tRNA synthetase
MRQSQLFTKTLREPPTDEIAANAILLERGGFVYKIMAGVYAYLPLGLRVLEKVNEILREEMNAVGGQELVMSALQPKDLWEKTGRWKELKEVMYQFKDTFQRELGLAITHEEPLTDVARRFISSYKDLPKYVYQIQLKFRNEPRAKSGLLRSREFLMKDIYSFDRDEEALTRSYEILKAAYSRYFKRVGLETRIVEASGGAFTKEFTHEFQVLSEAGEDEIFYCTSCAFAQNAEIATVKKGDACPSCGGKIELGKSIEVGHIYKLGTKYSEALGLMYMDEKGNKRPVFMGSYGIGPGRVIGAIVETHHDDKGIIWPESVAPFAIHLIELRNSKLENKNREVRETAEKLYADLIARGKEVLYDDRDDKTPGEKFADADLIGIPIRIVVSEKTLGVGAVEVKRRDEKTPKLVRLETLFEN